MRTRSPSLLLILLSLFGWMGLSDYVRAEFLRARNFEYVRAAKALGLSDLQIMVRHVLPNAAIPILTNTVTSLPFLILGSLLLERFFSIPGIGDLIVSALANGDFPVLKAVTVLSALALVAFNLLTDLLYAWADPRVRLT